MNATHEIPPLAVVSKRITIEAMRKYSGEGNIHSDDKAGAAWGLGGAIVQGGQLAGYLNEMMVRTFGERFLRGGELAVTFVKAVRSGDVVTTGGAVVEGTQGSERVEFDIWLQNEQGEKMTVGRASCPTSIG